MNYLKMLGLVLVISVISQAQAEEVSSERSLRCQAVAQGGEVELTAREVSLVGKSSERFVKSIYGWYYGEQVKADGILHAFPDKDGNITVISRFERNGQKQYVFSTLDVMNTQILAVRGPYFPKASE